jgi:hypothetical protein
MPFDLREGVNERRKPEPQAFTFRRDTERNHDRARTRHGVLSFLGGDASDKAAHRKTLSL